MIVTTSQQLAEVVDYFLQRDQFAFDVETVGDHALDPRRNEVTWISLATQGMGVAVPMGHPNGRLLEVIPGRTPTGKVSKNAKLATKVWSKPPAQLRPAEVFDALKPLLLSDRTKVGHNVKFDACSVAKYLGELPPKPFADTHVAAYLLKSNHRMVKGYPKPYSLGAVVHRELGYAYDKSVGAKINDHDFWEVGRYSHLDARMTWLAWKELKPQLERDSLTGLFHLEMDLLAVLNEMEMTGAPIDKDALADLWDDLTDEAERRKGACFAALGRTDVLLSSPQQLVGILFGPKEDGGLGLKPRKMTAGGKSGANPQPSTDDEALQPYRARVPFVAALLDYRETTKLLSTYVEPYLLGPVKQGKRFPPQMVNGRIHTNFNSMGAETGRFCVDPETPVGMPRDYTAYPDGVPLRDVKVGDLVYSFTWDKRLVLKPVKWVGPTKVAATKVVTVQSQNGRTTVLRLSAEHLVRKYRGEWQAAGALLPEDQLMGMASSDNSGLVLLTVLAVENGPVTQLWDMEVEDTHTFIGADVALHNSSSSPNLQNVPAPHTEEGRKIRGLFVAPSDDDVLIVGDYSQIEPRVLASLSGEPVLMDSYLKAEGDFYTAIAAPFGLDRKAGKQIFLSVAYGVGPDSLAGRIGITLTRARQVLEDFDQQFPVAAKYRRGVINDARRRRPCYVTTLMGRRRYLPDLASGDRGLRARAERQAFNGVIQGSAADIIKLSMVKTHASLAEAVPQARLILTVHDEIVATAPRSQGEQALEVMRVAMEGVNKLRVPLTVDIKVVDRWSAAK